MIIDQISVFVANKPGRLADITGVVSEASVDIRALSLADTTDFGILRLIVDNPSKAESVLRAEGLTVRRTKVIAARLEDKPGALHGVLKILTDAGISVEYAYAFINPKQEDACVILKVENNERAVDVFNKNGVPLLKPEEVYNI